MEQVIVNNDGYEFVRSHELYFHDGRLYQREVNEFMDTRFVDVTEDVAKAISEYITK